MPSDVETYRANAKQCEGRAEQMPPGLRRDLLVAARILGYLVGVLMNDQNVPSFARVAAADFGFLIFSHAFDGPDR